LHGAATARPAAANSQDGHSGGLTACAIGVSFALMPLLRPVLAAGITPEDLAIAAAVVVAFLWLGNHGYTARFPLVVSMGLMIGAGVLAGLVGRYPNIAAGAIAQDILLFAWFLAIANFCRTPSWLRIVIGAWVWSSIIWAALLVVAVAGGVTALAGQQVEGGRAALTFANPNQTGSYFAVSLMVILAAGYPRRRIAKIAAVCLVGAAMVLASSNAALGGTLLALLACSVLVIRRSSGAVPAIAASVTALTLVVAAGLVYVQFDIADAAKQSEIRILHNTVGRSQRSAEDRFFRFDELKHLYLQGGLLGYGPAATKAVLADGGRADPKGAHNDYLATLVERGLIGMAGLALLIGSLIWMMAPLALRVPAKAFADVIKAPRYLIGGVVIVAVASVSHEVLHFRHVWALFGLVAAVHLWVVDPLPDASDARERVDVGGGRMTMLPRVSTVQGGRY
jgi:O-antigen ligase